MKKLLIIFPILIASIFFNSCGEYPCAKADLRYGLIGFTNAESDTIIIRRFTKNSLVVKDSFFFDENNPIRFQRFADTLQMVAYTSDALLESNFDYQIFFPGAGKIFNIKDILETQSYGKGKSIFNTGGPSCINQIVSFNLDGVLSGNISSSRIYLTK